MWKMKQIQLKMLAFADGLSDIWKKSTRSTAQHRYTQHGIKENRSEDKYTENKDYDN